MRTLVILLLISAALSGYSRSADIRGLPDFRRVNPSMQTASGKPNFDKARGRSSTQQWRYSWRTQRPNTKRARGLADFRR
jgi:hypothetical protein